MAKVLLRPIGTELRDSDVREGQRERMGALDARLSARRAEVRAGWGEKYRSGSARRANAPPGSAWKPSLTTRRRSGRSTFVNYGEIFGGEGRPRPPPAS